MFGARFIDDAGAGLGGWEALCATCESPPTPMWTLNGTSRITDEMHHDIVERQGRPLQQACCLPCLDAILVKIR